MGGIVKIAGNRNYARAQTIRDRIRGAVFSVPVICLSTMLLLILSYNFKTSILKKILICNLIFKKNIFTITIYYNINNKN